MVFSSNELDMLILQNGSNADPSNSLYTWIRYSQKANGEGMTDDPTNAIYMGIATNKAEQIKSDDPSDYVWIKVRGENGLNGLPGKNGIPGQKGADGKTSYTHIAYADNSDGTKGFSFTDSDKEYVGMYTDYNQSHSTTPSSYLWSRIRGLDGKDGVPGKAGENGKTTYIHLAYANSPDGRNGFSITDSLNKVFIGHYTDYIKEDSVDPTKYKWSKFKGENGADGKPGKNGIDAYTIILSNENISFSVNNKNNGAIADQSYTSNILVFHGVKERKDFVVGEISPTTGLEVTKQGNVITIKFTKDAILPTESGSIKIPILIDGKTFSKDITWNIVKQGANGIDGKPGAKGDRGEPGKNGADGQSALSVFIGNEMQSIPCTYDGLVDENILLTIPFTAYEGLNTIDCVAAVGLLPDGITLGNNTPATPTSNGKIILNVAKGSALGSKNKSTGTIDITFTLKNKKLTKFFTWSKTKEGGLSTIYTVEPSSFVLTKTIDNTLLPKQITFKSYYQKNGVSRTEYKGRFVIEKTIDGLSYTPAYTSLQDESTIEYVPDSENIQGLRCSLYKAGGVTELLDRQSVCVLTDIDNLKPKFSEITTTISGVNSKIDAINKSINNKVWQSDITNALNTFDGSTIKKIRDQISEQNLTIDGFNSKISNVESTFNGNLKTINEQITELNQSSKGFMTKVSDTYASKDELNKNVTSITSQVEQTASTINSKIEDINGNMASFQKSLNSVSSILKNTQGDVSALKATTSEHTSSLLNINNGLSEVKQTVGNLSSTISNVKGDVSKVQQSVGSLSSTLSNAKGDISNIEQNLSSVTTELKNARGDKASLSLRIDGISKSVMNTAGEISTLNQKANELSSNINSANGDITSLQQKTNAISANISSVNKKLVDNYYTKTDIDTKIKLESGRITSTVSKIETVEKAAIINSIEEFYASTSPTELQGGTWSKAQPKWAQGQYIWRRVLTTKGDGTTSYSPSENGICISGNTGIAGKQGERGYGIVTSITRDGKDESWWNNFGSVGNVTDWANTESLRNGCRIGDLFTVVGKSTSGRSHTLTYQSTTASGLLEGKCISHTSSDKGEKGEQGKQGEKGKDGANGIDGKNGIDLSNGMMLFTDPLFLDGKNGTKNYTNLNANNLSNDLIEKSSDNPFENATRELLITNIGETTPGTGGFCWSHPTRANAIFIYRIIAKIPEGRNLCWASNETGNNGQTQWLTSQKGTGYFQEYLLKLTCGSSGSFSTTGYFYVDGAFGTSAKPFTWNVAYATCFDMTSSSDVLYAKETADAGKVVADEAIGRVSSLEEDVTTAISVIEQLDKQISMMVTDSNGSSLMTHTSSGWHFNIDSIQKEIENASKNISKITGDVVKAQSILNSTSKLAEALNKRTARIDMTTYDEQPAIILGKINDPFSLLITNTDIRFLENGNSVAWISKSALNITKAIIEDEIQIGAGSGWIWKKRSNGNLGLRWVK